MDNSVTFTAQELPHLPFLTEVSHETVARRPLAQPSRHLGPPRSLSSWRGANFAIARATHSSLWASQIALVVARCNAIAPATFSSLWIWASEIALVVARCEFCDRSRNTLATLGLSDRSRGGAVRIYRILRSLAQHSCHFGPLRSLSWWRGAMRSLPQPSRHFEFGPLRSLSLWRGANFAIARATLLLLWASQIALVVARCEFIEFCDCSRNALVTLGLSDRSRGGAVQCDRSRNLLVTLDLGLWDRSRCGAVRILRSLAQHSCHFGPLRSLSWYRILRSLAQRTRHFEMGLSDRFVVARCATFLALWACQIALVGALCWFCYIPYLSRRSCATETSYKDLVHRPLIEILYCLLQRSCQEVSSRTEILPRELFWRASTEIS